MARRGEEAFSNTQELISFRDLAALSPLDYAVMDHRRLDVFCMVHGRDGWKLIRPWLTASLDMRTRRWLAWTLVETPSSDSIAYVLKRSFLLYGLPKAVYWDNGKDFTCEWFEGRQTKSRQAEAAKGLNDGWRGVLETLGIRVHHAIVKRARRRLSSQTSGLRRCSISRCRGDVAISPPRGPSGLRSCSTPTRNGSAAKRRVPHFRPLSSSRQITTTRWKPSTSASVSTRRACRKSLPRGADGCVLTRLGKSS